MTGAKVAGMVCLVMCVEAARRGNGLVAVGLLSIAWLTLGW